MKKIRFLYLVVLLLMAALGAKADPLAVTSDDIGKLICTDGSIYATQNDAWNDSKTPVAMIAYADTRNGKALAIALSDAYYYLNNQYKREFQWAETADAVDSWVAYFGYSVTFSNATWKVPTIEEWQQMLIGCGAEGTVSDSPSDNTFTFAGLNEKLANVSGDKLQYSYWSATEYSQNKDLAWQAYFDGTYAEFILNDKVSVYNYAVRACLAFDIEVTEHVTVYEGLKITTADIGKFICADGKIYDTWSAADNDGKKAIAMIASVDAENHRALGFALYGDAPCHYWADAESTINSWADRLPDDDKKKLTSQYLSWELPTIQEWQQMFIGCGATGTVTDNPTTMSYSELKTKLENGNCSWHLFEGYNYYWTATEVDNDNAWTVRFSGDGTATFGNEEKTNTLGVQTYVSPCLSIAVYGETQPEPEPLSLNVTTHDLGKVVCTDGSIYATVTEATDDGKTPAGMIAYVDMELETGLAIALADETEDNSSRYLDWSTATAKAAAQPAIEGTTWKLPTKEEWEQMLYDEYTQGYSSTTLNNQLYNAGGTSLSSGYYYNQTLYSDYYWTSTTEENDDYDNSVYYAAFSNDNAYFTQTYWNDNDYHPQGYARACFAFNVEVTKYPITIDSNASNVQSNKTEAAEGETVGLTVTNIPEGYMVAGVRVEKADDSNVTVDVYRSNYDENVFYFTMPVYPVVVRYAYYDAIQMVQKINGLYYTLNSRTLTAEVAPHPEKGYSGAITIPATVNIRKTYTVTAIGREAFAGYSNNELTSVTCGSNITTIRRDAFYQTTMTSTSGDNARQLSRKKENAAQQGLIMNEGLTTIEQYAFRESNFDIEIPASVNNISRWAFKGYKGTKMSVRDGNTTYDSRDNCNAIIEKSQEFYVGGSYVPKVTIVAGCSASTFPSTVEAIGEAAFDGVGLTTVTIPSTIKILDTGAFANNPLTSIFIPKTVETIYTNPLYGCNQLQSIEVEAGNPNYDSRENCNAICEKEKRWVISTSKNTVIPKSITGIGTHAFAYRDDLNEYKVPKHITWIADNAFAYSNLYNVSMADNDDLYIGQWAFQRCGELRTVKIGRGIRNINQQVFKGCPNLSHIYVNAALPPKVLNYTFEIDDAGNTYSGKVHVPSASLKTYKKANFWKNLDLVASDGLQGVKAAFKQKKNGNATARGQMRRLRGGAVDLITEEGTIWSASGPTANDLGITTFAGESCLQNSSSTTLSLSNSAEEGFTISGSVKRVVVRAAGSVSNITCEIIDISDNAENTVADQTQSVAPTTTDRFKNYTLDFSGQEYSKAKVSVSVSGQASTYIAAVNIIQGGGDYVIAEASQITVNGIAYSNTLSAPAKEEDAEAIIDGAPVYVYTTCLPTAPEQSAGLKFYTLKSSTDNSLQFAEIEGAPQANTPYLVAVSSTTDIEMSIDESVTLKKETDNTKDIETYKFVGTTTGLTNAEAAAAGAYILQDGNVWGRVTTKNFEAYIPPFRAYIVPANANARPVLVGGFSSDSGEASAISTMQLTDRDGTTHYFDLQGRRIAKPAARGVYVVNGKKVLINK